MSQIIFDPRQSKNFAKAKVYHNLEAGIFQTLVKLSYFVFILGVFLFIYSRFSADSIYVKIAYFLVGSSSFYWFFYEFLFEYYLPSPVDDANRADQLSTDSIAIIEESINVTLKNKFASIEPIFLLAGIEKSKEGRYMLLRAGFGLDRDFSNIISSEINKIARIQVGNEPVFSPVTLVCIEEAHSNAIAAGRVEITAGDLLIGLSKSEFFQHVLFELKMDLKDLISVVNWYSLLLAKSKGENFLLKDTFGPGIGRDWSFGYTPVLNRFAININDSIEFGMSPTVYGRKNEIDTIENILAKSGQSNVILIGDHGIGKKTIINGFVQKIVKGEVLKSMRFMNVFKVDTGALLSGVGQQGEIEMRITRLFNEAARAGNIILFFEDFHALISAEPGVGSVNASEIILPYLSGGVHVIATTTLEQYHKSIEASPGIAAAFDRIEVKEPDETEVVKILEETVPYMESRDGIFWPYQSLKELIRVSARYVHNKPFPEKAIELADEVSVSAAKQGQKVINTDLIDSLVSSKIDVPVKEAEGEEAKKLINLEGFLHKRIIGQDEAIKAVASAMRRARTGIQDRNRPIGTFLFLGPTGVGKTETSKALAEAYFGSEKNMIRIDMSEFQEQSSVYRLIGSPPAAGKAGEKGQLTTAVADNPFSLVLLDEIEKAHKDILTLFLQVFDDGRLTDGTGRTIDFTNTIIIATSNAGSEFIRESLQNAVPEEQLKKSLLDFLQKQGIFAPEFLNRFDAVVAFHPLSREQIVQVAQLMLSELAKRMLEKEITVQFTPEAVQKLAQAGFDPVYGARPMRRAIQDRAENMIANNLLAGKITRGQRVLISDKDIA